MNSKTTNRTNVRPFDREAMLLSDTMRNALPGLGRLLGEGPSSGVAVNIKQRGEYDWIVVVKRETDAGEKQVLFGYSHGPFEALVVADKQVQGGRWRKDKPWAGNGR